jgi:uncharacterized protein with PIN domain
MLLLLLLRRRRRRRRLLLRSASAPRRIASAAGAVPHGSARAGERKACDTCNARLQQHACCRCRVALHRAPQGGAFRIAVKRLPRQAAMPSHAGTG